LCPNYKFFENYYDPCPRALAYSYENPTNLYGRVRSPYGAGGYADAIRLGLACFLHGASIGQESSAREILMQDAHTLPQFREFLKRNKIAYAEDVRGSVIVEASAEGLSFPLTMTDAPQNHLRSTVWFPRGKTKRIPRLGALRHLIIMHLGSHANVGFSSSQRRFYAYRYIEPQETLEEYKKEVAPLVETCFHLYPLFEHIRGTQSWDDDLIFLAFCSREEMAGSCH
jgi:hypothetical protein